MKYILNILFFCVCNIINAQVIEVSYNAESLFAQSFLNNAQNLPAAQKQELMDQFGGLQKHFSVQSDGKQVVRLLDSITQQCNRDAISMYTYQQLLIRNGDAWDKYVKIDERDSMLYQIKEREVADWKVDYKSTKNILGFKCYYAQNTLNNEEWAWFTLDIPLTVTPVANFTLKGVVLELKSSSDIYRASSVRMDSDMKKFVCWGENDETIKVLENFKTFSDILLSDGEKIDTDMFDCRE